VTSKLLPAAVNSLNNRFTLPIEHVTTDCILSLDDDMSALKPKDILFGFNVWIQNSDRIVGFPSKSHRWDSKGTIFMNLHFLTDTTNTRRSDGWQYVPEQYDRFSFILTGAAFYHRFYAWLYSRISPSLHAMVDQNRNCEDLVFNMATCSILRWAHSIFI
jgi:hypothetical protein